MKKILDNNLVLLIIVLIICIPVVAPFFKEGYFPTHDGEWAVVRLADMFRTLRDFQIPPRFSGALNFGYGYPLFNFAYPFPYYLGLLFYVGFHNFVLSIKTIFVASVFLSGIGMYLASNLLWRNRMAAVVSSVLYVYLPYRMVDLYVRGSIGESVAFALFPFIFYFSTKLFDTAFSRFSVVTLSILLGILVMTHNIMTILFLPVLLAFMIARILREKRFDVVQSFFLCIVLGAGLSVFFWVPALLEKGNILLSKIPIADRNLYFVDFKQLIFPSWGYGSPTGSDGFSYQLGPAHIAIIALIILVLGFSFVKTKFMLTPHKFYSTTLLAIYLVCLVMLFSITGVVWKTLPLLSEINYPWILLSQLGFITALSAGFLIGQGRYFKYAVIALCIVAVFLTLPYAKPKSFNNTPDQQYLTNEATTTSSSELMPLWVKEHPKSRYGEKVIVVSGNASISNLEYSSKKISFKYDAVTDPVFRINTIYYPGWKAYLDNEKVGINYDNAQGVMEIQGS